MSGDDLVCREGEKFMPSLDVASPREIAPWVQAAMLLHVHSLCGLGNMTQMALNSIFSSVLVCWTDLLSGYRSPAEHSLTHG